MKITDCELEELRKRVGEILSDKRFSHTLSVERCAKYLATLIIPDEINEVCAAALLHDVTKELSSYEQLVLLRDEALTKEDLDSVEVLHSFSAPIRILNEFPRYNDPRILSAVRKHTLGDSDMSLFDMIVFISDYAEETRRADACQEVRRFLFNDIERLSFAERKERLIKACLMAISKTRDFLIAGKKHINSRMNECEKFLKEQILQR